MTRRVSYTTDSVERALNLHRDAGRFRTWVKTTDGRYIVGLNRMTDPGQLELRTLREAWIFVAGLASAHHAPASAQP